MPAELMDVNINTSPPPSPRAPSGSKRKASELGPAPSSDGIVCTGEKKLKVAAAAPSLVKLSGSKFGFSQRAAPALLSGATSTLKDLLEWKEFYASDGAAEELEAGIPGRFSGLVVKLCHESEKSSANLAKQLRSELDPATTDSSSSSTVEALSISNLEKHLATLLERTNYGLDASDLGLEPEAKIPPGLLIWRWEAKDRSAHLPKDSLVHLEKRHQDRLQARIAARALWDDLSSAQKEAIFKPASKSSKPATETESQPAPKPKEKAKALKGKAKEDDEDPEKAAKKAEKAQKDQEKAEKKAVRELKAKEKKDKEDKAAEVHSKQMAAMNNFFKKPAAPVKKSEASPSARPSLSDFDRTFLPFEKRKGVEVAPINRFSAIKARKLAKSKGSDELMEVDLDYEATPTQDLLRSFISSVSSSSIPRSAKYASPSIKSGPITASVREIFDEVQEAEISGRGDPHEITACLKDHSRFPRKFLQFREDTRPAYNGTWTQTSSKVGPRTPHAQDARFDYDYDSGVEWEEEDGEGDDLESLAGSARSRSSSVAARAGGGAGGGGSGAAKDMWDTDEEDGDFGSDGESESDDSDGEDDPWMVDDKAPLDGTSSVAAPSTDDADLSPAASTRVEPDEGAEVIVLGSSPVKPLGGTGPGWLKPKKALKDKGKKKEKGGGGKKKKKGVKQIVPVVRGPFFEEELGVCGWEGFTGYRIQMLNDTPASIDPFTYVAAPLPSSIDLSALSSSSATPASAVPRHLSQATAGPSTPSKLTSASSFIDDSSASTDPSASSTGAPSSSGKKPGASSQAPKKPFPKEHLPAFLTRISRSTKTAVLLSVELKEVFGPLGVRQNQVDWELKTRAKRQGKKEGSRWVVGDQDWKDAGMTGPPPPE